ncbi:MAG TPA: C40 family peptidase [Candidatus Blautia excrementipullorum]|nr:C40 family peptidase [Candidatus Blautia excrementipullorum]
MAAPAAIIIVKASLAAATDKQVRTAILSVGAAVLMPFIFIIAVILCALSGAANHNTAAVRQTFHGGYVSAQMPTEYRSYIGQMQSSFRELDGIISEINSMAEGGTVDAYRVKAIFYSLFFGADQAGAGSYHTFADCFVDYEEREDDEGNPYTVAIPISNLETVYANLSATLGREITLEDKTNAQRIYTLAQSGENGLVPGEALGDGSYAALMSEAEKYIGMPYVWGGSTPATGFDCSGYVCWVYSQAGVAYLPRTTAQGIFNRCAVISREEAQPGDLIFFTGTYASGSTVTHLGIYVGNGQMLHAGNPIGYADIDSPYWSRHYYACGRLSV